MHFDDIIADAFDLRCRETVDVEASNAGTRAVDIVYLTSLDRELDAVAQLDSLLVVNRRLLLTGVEMKFVTNSRSMNKSSW
jgi:hypothetical protein